MLADKQPAATFAATLAPLLGDSATAAERDLIQNTPVVLELTRSFSPLQQHALLRCVRIMSSGMADFQRRASHNGLRDIEELDQYCYYVAGVVGEMLMELFCEYSPEFAAHSDETLRPLAISFGQGLQMTNILKDIWDDQQRSVCWLPQSVFEGFDLAKLDPAHCNLQFEAGLNRLIGIARGHLENALRYIILLPPHEVGIRRFCLWALGMALLTLRRIHAKPTFQSGQAVKISRRSVKSVVLVSNTFTRQDWALRLLFKMLARGLP